MTNFLYASISVEQEVCIYPSTSTSIRIFPSLFCSITDAKVNHSSINLQWMYASNTFASHSGGGELIITRRKRVHNNIYYHNHRVRGRADAAEAAILIMPHLCTPSLPLFLDLGLSTPTEREEGRHFLPLTTATSGRPDGRRNNRSVNGRRASFVRYSARLVRSALQWDTFNAGGGRVCVGKKASPFSK